MWSNALSPGFELYAIIGMVRARPWVVGTSAVPCADTARAAAILFYRRCTLLQHFNQQCEKQIRLRSSLRPVARAVFLGSSVAVWAPPSAVGSRLNRYEITALHLICQERATHTPVAGTVSL